MQPPPGNFFQPRPQVIQQQQQQQFQTQQKQNPKGKGKGRGKGDGVCYSWRNTGTCARGAACPFKHI